MELELERYLREVAERDNIYKTDPEKIDKMTFDLMGKGEYVFQFFFLGDNTNSHAIGLANWWSPFQGGKTLDVGAGTGILSCLMTDLNGSELTVFNINEVQLQIASDNIHKVQGDMNEPWPFEDGTFTEVLLLYSLGHGRLDHIMKEAKRVLSPEKGGLFIYDMAVRDVIPATERLKYVFYHPSRVIEEALDAGFYLARAGVPYPTYYHDPSETISLEEMKELGADPFIYRFAIPPSNSKGGGG